jgi:hypothetical protein
MYWSKSGDRKKVQKLITALGSTPGMTASAGSGARAVGLAAAADALGLTDGAADADAAGAGVAIGDGDTTGVGEQAVTTSARSAVSATYRCLMRNVGQRTVTLNCWTELFP